MAETVLSMNHINKSFGGVPVLKNVDFSIKKGSIHALVGGNGAGKSTLMKIMTGVYSCDNGTVTVNGEEKKITKPNIARDSGIRMIFQELSLIPTLSVVENIFLNHEIKKGAFVDKKEMNAKAQELLDEIGVKVDVNKRVGNLEIGICQLIEIAKALSSAFSVLIMDEPTASLTEEETQNLFQIMRNLQKKGASIVYISHRLKEVLEISDEITVLRDGEVIRTDSNSAFSMESLIGDIIGKNEASDFEYIEREGQILDEVMLRVENLSWEENHNKISFEVKKGEVVGLVGLLGSGRTEIVEALFGIRKHKGTQIYVDGKEVRIRNVQDAVENGIALIPEDRRTQGLTLTHSIMDNTILPNLKQLTKGGFLHLKHCRQMSEECISEFNVKANGVNDMMLNLSGGNQQKVVIGKWFATEPKVILMDEPTAGVDIGAKTEIIELIRRFVERQKSVVFISSELSEVLGVCDRVIVLKDGGITQEIRRSTIHNEEELQHAVQA